MEPRLSRPLSEATKRVIIDKMKETVEKKIKEELDAFLVLPCYSLDLTYNLKICHVGCLLEIVSGRISWDDASTSNVKHQDFESWSEYDAVHPPKDA